MSTLKKPDWELVHEPAASRKEEGLGVVYPGSVIVKLSRDKHGNVYAERGGKKSGLYLVYDTDTIYHFATSDERREIYRIIGSANRLFDFNAGQIRRLMKDHGYVLSSGVLDADKETISKVWFGSKPSTPGESASDESISIDDLEFALRSAINSALEDYDLSPKGLTTRKRGWFPN